MSTSCYSVCLQETKISSSPLHHVLSNLNIEHEGHDSLGLLCRKLKRYILQLRNGKDSEQEQHEKHEQVVQHREPLVHRDWDRTVYGMACIYTAIKCGFKGLTVRLRDSSGGCTKPYHGGQEQCQHKVCGIQNPGSYPSLPLVYIFSLHYPPTGLRGKIKNKLYCTVKLRGLSRA